VQEDLAVGQDEQDVRRGLSLAHGQVCYLQVPSSGPERSAEFYTAVFGRDVRSHAPDFEAPGLIGQWITDRTAARDAGPLLWIYVTDMTEALRLARARGGKVVMPPAADGPVRTLATIADPDGNLIGPRGVHAATVTCPPGAPLP
jgi:predicted enzyme related to lactoylglutathione lyase